MILFNIRYVFETNLVPSALLMQATFVPVSDDCTRGQLMKNLCKEAIVENYQKCNHWKLDSFVPLALTLPLVIFRSAVDTMVDTVVPLTSALKVAW